MIEREELAMMMMVVQGTRESSVVVVRLMKGQGTYTTKSQHIVGDRSVDCINNNYE